MRVLVIGGTGFIGPHVVRALAEAGHEVAVFHRGRSSPALPVEHLLGDRVELSNVRWKADVVIDLILSSGRQAEALVHAFRGKANRLVIASSCDVYCACGVLHGSEPGPPESVPLTEESPQRTKLQTYPPEQLQAVRQIYPWVDEDYDKIPVERAVMAAGEPAGTVLRLPMVYGPGDPLRRFFPILRRVADRRTHILIQEEWADWKGPRGYVENVAHAIALAAVDDRAINRIYNVGDQPSFTEFEWARTIAHAAGWNGSFLRLPQDRLPKHLMQRGNAAQPWVIDTSRIERELGYRAPVTTALGVRRTVEWDLANLPASFPIHPIDYIAEDAALR